MEKVTALQLRQNLGSIIRRLHKTRKSMILYRGREPVAALVELSEFKKRFVDVEADQLRNEAVGRIRSAKIALPVGVTSDDLVRDLRLRDSSQ